MKRISGGKNIELNGMLRGIQIQPSFIELLKPGVSLKRLMKHDDQVLLDKSDIESHILNYYQGLFAIDNACQLNDLVAFVIPSLVSAQNNAMLTNFPSMVEVKNVVFAMNANGGPGLDGFGGWFYHL